MTAESFTTTSRPTYPTLTKLGELIARADALINQRTGLAAVHAAAARRKEVRRGLQFQLLRYLIRVGEAAARRKPDLAMRFVLPDLATPVRSFLPAVREMLEVAEAEREFLTGVGLSDQALADLKREVGEFEAAAEAQHVGRREHVGASADLLKVANEAVVRA